MAGSVPGIPGPAPPSFIEHPDGPQVRCVARRLRYRGLAGRAGGQDSISTIATAKFAKSANGAIGRAGSGGENRESRCALRRPGRYTGERKTHKGEPHEAG